MCRFVAYLGNDKVILEELLEKPENSLIKQSHKAREGILGINADGFGIAWYDFEIDNMPAIFKSIQPAWNDYNLSHIAKKIKSNCFVGHIRASTVGDVIQSNCHPFTFQNYLMAHNGTIRNFPHLKRKLLEIFDDELFFNIKGNTDSECFFFLIMHFLQKTNNDLIEAVKNAIRWVVKEQKEFGEEDFSRINMVITNGKEIMVTRFVTKDNKSLLLNYSPKHIDGKIVSIIFSSEVLTDSATEWHEVEENSYIYLNKNDMQLHKGQLRF